MTTNSDVVVRTEHLTKHYGKLVAVDDLNLEVHRGEVFGFLGPNGAGKTTAMCMILGLIAPTSGVDKQGIMLQVLISFSGEGKEVCVLT